MYELKKKKIGKVFTSKFVGTGPSSYENRIYWATVSQRFKNTGLHHLTLYIFHTTILHSQNSVPACCTIIFIVG